MSETLKARVFMSGRSQHVTIPAEFRFTAKEVYVQQNPHTGALTFSERPLHRPIEDIFRDLDEAGAADFVLERDMSPPPDLDLF